MIIDQHIKKIQNEELTLRLTIGQVIDTNDPQQMGRIRAYCPGLGDTPVKKIEDIPWAVYVSPFGGVVTYGKRGPEEDEIKGPVAYGWWSIPKVGAYVLVGCIDGDPSARFWIGCIQPQLLTHTMPHGRYLWNSSEEGKAPDGPVDTFEQPIEPLYRNLTKAFTKDQSLVENTPSTPRDSLEWRTRGADMQVSALEELHISLDDPPGSEKPDHKFGKQPEVTEQDGNRLSINGPGYGKSQIEPERKYKTTIFNYDSHVYSWTTPGFHSISIDDRKENSRIRIRTASGHQIIFDDTNERIYISTAEGETWIEMDQNGNIDIYGGRNLSVHAKKDINFTANETFRVHAKGIHMYSSDEIRLHSKKDFNVYSEENYRLATVKSMFIEPDENLYLNVHQSVFEQVANDIHRKVGGSSFYQTSGELHFNTSGDAKYTSGGTTHIRAGGDIIETGSSIHLNGPPASQASQANDSQPAEEKHSFWTSRVPEHEPWARVMMKGKGPGGADNDGTTVDIANEHTPEYSYDDKNVGRVERGERIKRNKHWHR